MELRAHIALHWEAVAPERPIPLSLTPQVTLTPPPTPSEQDDLTPALPDALNLGIPESRRHLHHCSTFVDDTLMANIRDLITNDIAASKASAYLLFGTPTPNT